MKIVIVGPGAMGCLFGGFLVKSGQEAWLLDKRPERVNRIKKYGLRIEGISGKHRIRVNITDNPTDIGTCDLIIVFVKSYDTEKAIKSARNLIEKDTSVLSLQNGIGNIEIISKVVGRGRVIGGVTAQGATLLGDGYIRHAGRGETIIGKVGGGISARIRQIRDAFNQAGLKTKTSGDINSLIWSKLVINVGINPLTAITRLNNGRLIEYSQTRTILHRAVSEAVRVAKAKRIRLIYDDPIKKVESVCKATGPNVSSMLQDVLKGKRTEIDFINGFIVREGRKLKVPMPVNSVLVDLVKTIESSYDKQLSR